MIMAARPAPGALAFYLAACTVHAPRDWVALRPLFAGMDELAWSWLVETSRAQGLAGLMARNLEWAAQTLAIAIPVSGMLAAERRRTLARSLARRSAAREAMDALVKRDIRFVLFKGFSLAEEIYGDLSLRSFLDCDLLVEDYQAEAAAEALRDAGYRAGRSGSVATYRAMGHHAVPLMNHNGEAVDLHWDLGGHELGREPASILWANTYTPTEAKLPGLRLTPEMNFIYLATHFYRDSFTVFRTLLDAYMVAHADGTTMNAEKTRALAGQLNRGGVARLAARLCTRDFRPLPFITAMAEGPSSLQTSLALRFLSRERLLRVDIERHDPNPAFRIALAGGAYAAMFALRDALFPTRSELSSRFGRPFEFSMYPTYYGRQAFRVLTRSNKHFFEYDDK